MLAQSNTSNKCKRFIDVNNKNDVSDLCQFKNNKKKKGNNTKFSL